MIRKLLAYTAGAAGAALALRLAVRNTHRIDFAGRSVVITGGRGLANVVPHHGTANWKETNDLIRIRRTAVRKENHPHE